MTLLDSIGTIVTRWTDVVAAGLRATLGRIASPRTVRLIEEDGGGFSLQGAGQSGADGPRLEFVDGRFAGADLGHLVRRSRVEVILRPARFLLRPLELPARAADFIDGIVRAQIDRLTPWTASQAIFGCSRPRP